MENPSKESKTFHKDVDYRLEFEYIEKMLEDIWCMLLEWQQ